MQLVTVLDPDYPPNLSAVHDRPPMVFINGALTPQDANARGRRRRPQRNCHGRQARPRRSPITSSTAATRSYRAWPPASTPQRTRPRSPETAARVAVIGTGLARAYPPAEPSPSNAGLPKPVRGRLAVLAGLTPQPRAASRCATPSCPGSRSPPSSSRLPTRAARARRPASHSPTAGRCSCSARSSSASLGRASTQRVPARTSSTDPAEITAALERLIAPGSLVA